MKRVVAATTEIPAGGGAYALPEVTIGIFHADQSTHTLTRGSSRREHRPLTKGDGWIMPAGAEGFCEFEKPMRLQTTSIPSSLLRDLGVTIDLQAHQGIVGGLSPVLVQLAGTVADSAGKGTLYAQTMEMALAAEVGRALRPPKADTIDIADQRLNRVIEYIHDNLDADLALDTMANHAAMSVSHFSRAFRNAVGTAPLQYVIGQRLELALVYLRTTKLTVSEIAYRVGYTDVSRFGQHFSRRFGRTPAKARE